MQALNFDGKIKHLELTQKKIPEIINARDVLIKVAFSGICGTDLHILQGEFPCKQDAPITLGHEFSGTVVKIGHNVKTLQVGDEVCVDPNHGCDTCQFCRSGNPHFCKVGGLNNTVGIYRDGGWAEYSVVPELQVHKLPKEITLKQAALCEPLSCLAHGWDRLSPLNIGKRILVIGAGIIGNLWIICLHMQGHKKVTVSEPNESRLQKLRDAFHQYDFVHPDKLSERQKLDADYQFEIVIDCSGNNHAIEQGFNLLTPGGKLCIFGVAPPHSKLSISPYEIFKKELTILGVNINPFTFPKALGLVETLGDKYLDYNLLGIKTFKLKEYQIAMEALKKGTIAKAIFVID